MSNQAGLGIGDKVHNAEINEYPDDMKAEYLWVSTWAKDIAQRFGRGVVVKVIDPQSLVGLYKILRHRIRRYPTFIVDGEMRLVGRETEAEVTHYVAERLVARGWPVPEVSA